ncbi:MAG: cysteine sulfinate desulfinase [Omnitrophica bacterium RIFCSPLOWO2_12_FULL_50_11]|nr:MAG: cysteine sulfinate desulfinase [Omnitrophica bacterium RIFCSPLOWO2_12_FULL_50_11]
MLKTKPDGKTAFDVARYRKDFPILAQKVYGKPLVYLDNAATTQKPRQVIDALREYYETENANIHRGIFYLSERATEDYEQVRTKVQQFIHARASREIIFVRGTTEGINLVAQSYGRTSIKRGDEIIISAMEHHSNIVPWQMLCEEAGARLRIAPINDEGELLIDEYEKLFNRKTKLAAMTHVSNSLGTINPVRQIIRVAHRFHVPVLIDGAQAAPHLPIDVQDLDCDFYVFSGHKMYGPTGVGVVYGKAELLEKMPPYQGGGDMISSVTFEKTTYNVLPFKFEAGTPNIADVIAFGRAMDYLGAIGYGPLAVYEHDLLACAAEALSRIKGLKIIGTAKEKASVVSFVLRDVHPHDIGTMLDRDGIAIRAGHHCTMPLMDRFGIPATARASFAFYNTKEEIEALRRSVEQVVRVFK